jgi:hypothetical protein
VAFHHLITNAQEAKRLVGSLRTARRLTRKELQEKGDKTMILIRQKSIYAAIVLAMGLSMVMVSQTKADQGNGIPFRVQALENSVSNLQSVVAALQNKIIMLQSLGITQAVHGQIAYDGSIMGGTGFTVNHSQTGMYTIDFTNVFAKDPTCLVVGWNNSNVACYTPFWGEKSLEVWCLTYPWDSNVGDPNGYIQEAVFNDYPFNFICVE